MRRFLLIIPLLLLVACRREDDPATPTPTATAIVLVEDSPTVVPDTPLPLPTDAPTPTATPRPMVATVNGEPIWLSDYERELEKFQEWFPDRAPDGRDVRAYTLDQLIEQTLIGQIAVANGWSVSAETIDTKIAEAITSAGGDDAYRVWLDNSGFTEETFRTQVAQELLIQFVLEQVTADVPTTTEFVRARYIQVDDRELADTILLELANGADFVTLVDLHSVDPFKEVTRGDLGFFERGMLTIPEVEATAFALEPLAISEVVTVTKLDGSETYYIVQMTKREPFRPYSAERRAELLQETWERWLAEQYDNATIDVMIGFD